MSEYQLIFDIIYILLIYYYNTINMYIYSTITSVQYNIFIILILCGNVKRIYLNDIIFITSRQLLTRIGVTDIFISVEFYFLRIETTNKQILSFSFLTHLRMLNHFLLYYYLDIVCISIFSFLLYKQMLFLLYIITSFVSLYKIIEIRHNIKELKITDIPKLNI